MFLVISLGDQRFALPLEVVTEIFLASAPRAAIRAPFGCLGLVEVRGQMVPLLDLATLLGLRRPLSRAAPGAEYLHRSIVLTQLQGSSPCNTDPGGGASSTQTVSVLTPVTLIVTAFEVVIAPLLS